MSGATFSGPSVLLSTAMVGIEDAAGETLMFRTLLVSGSQTSLITADVASELNISRSTVDVKISGIGGRQQAAKDSVNLVIGHDNVKQQYRDFIKEFVDIGHLEQAPQTHDLCYYLPHHCVFKNSTTTKLRVVFDARSKSPIRKPLGGRCV